MSTVSGRSGAFELGRLGACIRPVRGPRMQHHSPLTLWRTSWQDGPMREGVSRALGTRPGASGSWGPGAHVSRLLWAAATLGLRPDPFAALLWWWTRVATTATGPLRQLQGYPRPVARAGAPTSRLHDRRRRTGAAGQRLWPQPSHHRRRPGRTRGHGARLDPAGKGARRVAARPRHHQGPHVGPDAACDRPSAEPAGTIT